MICGGPWPKTAQEIADILGVNRATFYAWARGFKPKDKVRGGWGGSHAFLWSEDDVLEILRRACGFSPREFTMRKRREMAESAKAFHPLRNACRSELRRKLLGLLRTLTFREAELVKLRYGLNSDGCIPTLDECGKIFHVSRERVRQIEAKAIRKLQHPRRAKRVEACL